MGISLNDTAIPNDEAGIRVFYHAAWTFIGPGNISAYNPNGVEINGALNFNNVITRNSTSPTRTWASSSGQMARTTTRLPLTLTAASTSAVAGTSCAGCTVEIFVAQPNPSDSGGGLFGQGRTFAGWGVVAGDGHFSIPVTGVQASDRVTATATDAVQNTSRFSQNLAVGTGSPPPPNSPPPPPPPTGVVASDGFTRTTTDTWGSAPVGGGYAYRYCTAYDLDINGSTGTMSVPNPRVTADCPNQPGVGVPRDRGAWLDGHVGARCGHDREGARQQVRSLGTTRTSRLSARRWRGQTEYRPEFRFTTGGEVWMQAYKQVTGTLTGLGINTQGADRRVWCQPGRLAASPGHRRQSHDDPDESLEPGTDRAR